MDLTRIRKNIDDIDNMIITLLAKRSDMVSAAGRLKKNDAAVRDPRRVDQVIEKVRAKAIEKGLDPEIAESVYRTVILCFIDKELRDFNREKKTVMQG